MGIAARQVNESALQETPARKDYIDDHAGKSPGMLGFFVCIILMTCPEQ